MIFNFQPVLWICLQQSMENVHAWNIPIDCMICRNNYKSQHTGSFLGGGGNDAKYNCIKIIIGEFLIEQAKKNGANKQKNRNIWYDKQIPVCLNLHDSKVLTQ